MMQNQAANRRDEARKAYIDQDTQRRMAKEQEARTAIDQSTDMMRKDQFTLAWTMKQQDCQVLYGEVTGKNIIPTMSNSGVPQLVKDTNQNGARYGS